MSFIIFGDAFSFPDGNAATNRVHTYARGFFANGINVHVICFKNDYLDQYDGEIDGIHYYHPFSQRKRNKYFIVRRWQKFIKYFRTLRLIRKISSKEKILAINCWTLKLSSQLFAYFIAKLVRTKLICEHSEHPLRNFQSNTLRKIHGEVKSFLETTFCDGIFCISRYLIDFYSSRRVKMKKLFLVPSTVDIERFSSGYKSPVAFNYILYCGELTIMKDGVDILIESFAKISDKYPDLKLVLLGQSESSDTETKLQDLIIKLNLVEQVYLPGRLHRTLVPAYLTNAKVLALARPKSIVADAGFPSKLTEYLATGVPVVVTKVGEILDYLIDNENAFLSEPDNIDAFAEKLAFVLANYDFALKVAAKGQKLTMDVFNYVYQSKRMIGFIHSLQ